MMPPVLRGSFNAAIVCLMAITMEEGLRAARACVAFLASYLFNLTRRTFSSWAPVEFGESARRSSKSLGKKNLKYARRVDDPGPRRRLPEDNAVFVRDDWPLIRKKLRWIAYKKTYKQSMPRAEDLAQASLLKCLEHNTEPWTKPHGKLVAWLAGVVGRMVFNEGRRAEKFPHVPLAEELGPVDTDDGASYTAGAILAARGPSPEEAAIAAEEAAIFLRRLDALAARVADDALVSLLVAEVRRGAESPIDAARAKGFTPDDVYNGRKRLERAAHAVLDEERGAPPSAEEARS